jgi:hypothetical protein
MDDVCNQSHGFSLVGSRILLFSEHVPKTTATSKNSICSYEKNDRDGERFADQATDFFVSDAGQA